MSDRKYRQHGYQDREDKPKNSHSGGAPSKPRGETFGPRQVNMAPTRSVSRCAQCGVVLPVGAQAKCPKCGFDLHSCKQCTHFDPGARFECRQPITVRIARKDELNVCTFYSMSVRVERETSLSQPSYAPGSNGGTPSTPASNSGGTSNRVEDARRAFDALFKK